MATSLLPIRTVGNITPRIIYTHFTSGKAAHLLDLVGNSIKEIYPAYRIGFTRAKATLIIANNYADILIARDHLLPFGEKGASVLRRYGSKIRRAEEINALATRQARNYATEFPVHREDSLNDIRGANLNKIIGYLPLVHIS